ncbi:carnitine palmitoyltransferase 2 isoform X2 [Tachypleus tridentatus]|uniref:carnitine palmitoyltransferase 2 isoform X2 n=1 Tax=Tachypleus tridentatus TaxID=6853 RepID=UPI003FD4E8F5
MSAALLLLVIRKECYRKLSSFHRISYHRSLGNNFNVTSTAAGLQQAPSSLVVYCRHLSSKHANDSYQYLEKCSLPTMYFQASLPRLPIPELEKTCERYLTALKPIISQDQMKKTEEIVNRFRSGEGKVLHDELVALDKQHRYTSYISGPWFEMYLKSRLPLVINFNPFMAFKDDPKHEYNHQLVRATNMLVSSLRFFKSLKENLLKPEVFHLNPTKSDTEKFLKFIRWFPKSVACYGAYWYKAFPLDMSQFDNLLCSTRIPRHGQDEIQAEQTSKHMAVLRKGHIYVFDALDQDGNIFPPSHLYSCLAYILTDNHPVPTHPVGVLTTENRDQWATVREMLKDAGNKEQLRLIDSAIYVMVFEDETVGEDHIKAASTMLHGPFGNRWFDKSFQLIITKDGKAALNFEHAWGDGVAVLRFFNEVYKDSIENHHIHPNSTIPSDIDPSQFVRRLEFSMNEPIKTAIHKAQDNYEKLTSTVRLHVMQYERMNRDFIKKQRLSPDAIMQLAFQMAYYKQYGKTVATYESCSTSAFKHGRTETLRPATMATKKCTEAFNSRCKPTPLELRSLLMECSKLHNKLTKEAAMGQGFDRHMFGLKHMALKKGTLFPEIFQDEAYIAANHFILSTSTLSGPAFQGGGFGAVVPNGYGLAYGFFENMLGCLVSSYDGFCDGKQFVECMESGLNEIHDVLYSTRSELDRDEDKRS